MAYPTHGECANFRDGRCLLLGVEVDPNGPACPNFTPRSAPIPTAPSPPSELWRIKRELEELRWNLRLLEMRLKRLKSMRASP